MDFVRIETLDDVTPHISNEHGFVVSRRQIFTVVDYVFSVPESFETAIALECRGLKFDRDGRIIGRPFHKFFNLGERQRVEDIDWTLPHRVEPKLDGSMVHPVLLDGELVFMTRMGATAQAQQARTHADAGLIDLSGHLVEAGITPVFEFTAPDNRIVVAYDEPRLTLLAARHIITGDYLPHDELARLAARFAVRLIEDTGPIGDAKAFVARARSEMGIEGYVLAFADGHRIKLKADAYVLRHKALAGVQLEKNVLAWVASRAVDDVVAILPPEIAARVVAFEAQVLRRVNEIVAEIEAFVAAHAHLPRKDFAALAFKTFDKRLTFAIFIALDGKDVRAALLGQLQQAAQSEPKVDAVRDLYRFRWSMDGLAMPDLEN